MLARRMSGFHEAVYVALRPSTRLLGAMLAAHLLAGGAVAVLYPPSLEQGVLMAAIALNAFCLRARLARPRADDIAAVLLGSNDEWRVSLADGSVVAARLALEPYVTVYLTALTLTLADGRRRHVLLLPDNVEANAYRRLRVRLRFARYDAGADRRA